MLWNIAVHSVQCFFFLLVVGMNASAWNWFLSICVYNARLCLSKTLFLSFLLSIITEKKCGFDVEGLSWKYSWHFFCLEFKSHKMLCMTNILWLWLCIHRKSIWAPTCPTCSTFSTYSTNWNGFVRKISTINYQWANLYNDDNNSLDSPGEKY